MTVEPLEILVAEDNDDDILMIKHSFSQAKIVNGLQIVKDGEEALAYLRKKGKYKNAKIPGMVLLDINMPKKDGFEVLQEIKGDANLKHLPVIILTTSKREEDVARSYANGACSYIPKPVGMQQFQEVVRQFDIYWTMVSAIPKGR